MKYNKLVKVEEEKEEKDIIRVKESDLADLSRIVKDTSMDGGHISLRVNGDFSNKAIYVSSAEYDVVVGRDNLDALCVLFVKKRK